jgi:hypothetical protein
MMGTRQHKLLCTNAECAGLVPECCRRLGKELFGDNAVRLSGPSILVLLNWRDAVATDIVWKPQLGLRSRAGVWVLKSQQLDRALSVLMASVCLAKSLQPRNARHTALAVSIIERALSRQSRPELKAAGETLQREQSLGGGEGCRGNVVFSAFEGPQKQLCQRGQRRKLIGLCQWRQQPLLC